MITASQFAILGIVMAESESLEDPKGPVLGDRVVGEPIVPTDRQEVDAGFLARLLLGAQTEHEQRLTAVRLLRRDAGFRSAVAAILEPFEMFDADLAAEYGRILSEEDQARAEPRRRELLDRAYLRAPDLQHRLRHLTYSDVLQLGEATRQIFSWSMAELLLQRARRVGVAEYEVKSSLYLALMVIDVVELLGAAGHSPELPEVVADVRRRIAAAAADLYEPQNRSG